MKHLIVILICISFLFVGCAGISIDNNSKELFVKMSARVFGYKIAKKDPKLIEPAKVFCQAVMQGNVEETLLNTAKEVLLKTSNGDPLLTASLIDLMGLVTVKNETGTTVFDNTMVKVAASGFLEGILLYQGSIGL